MTLSTLPRFQHYINGEHVAPASGDYFETQNPFTGQTWATVARGNAADVDCAVRAARCAPGL